MISPVAWIVVLGLTITSAPVLPAHSDDIRRDQWYVESLRLAEAHRHATGQDVVVAVVDTGVDPGHPDLRGNVVRGVDLVSGSPSDGRIDADGHGTGMASLIAGHGHAEDSGILGVAPQARILPVRISTPRVAGDANDVARGIEWAVEHDAAVICIPNVGGVSASLMAAVRFAHNRDIVIVAAAGNYPEQSGVAAPASFPGVVAAAAVDRNGRHHPVSVTGPEIVLAAPGVDIVSASKDRGYRDGTGTSDAAAIIAGAAALIRAKYPDLSAEQVIRRLTETADDRGPAGRDEQYGYGVLDLVEALTAPLDRSTTPARAAPTADRPGSEGQVTAGPVGLVLFLLLAAAGAGALAAALAVRRWRQR